MGAEGGCHDTPKNDDVIYEQPLSFVDSMKTNQEHWCATTPTRFIQYQYFHNLSGKSECEEGLIKEAMHKVCKKNFLQSCQIYQISFIATSSI